jgi:hypothetical protein
MGGMAGVLAQAGSSMASGASAVGSAMGSAAQGAANVGKAIAGGAADAGKNMLANAWNEASGGITSSDNLEDAAYKTGKALVSKEYSKAQPVQLQSQEASAPPLQVTDAKNELEKLMSNFT